MAYAYLTMLDLAKMNGSDQVVGLIEENLNAAPEIQVLPARQIKGTSFKTLVREGYPTTSFRQVNMGNQPTKSTYINKQFELSYYDGQMEIDNAVATADELGVDHALALEADGHGRAFLLTAGKQVWYGASADPNGFPGAHDIVDPSLLVDATGTTATTASSVYAVVAAQKFMEIIPGNNTVLTAGQWRLQTISRTVNSVAGEITAWKNALEGWIGAAWYSKYACGRVKNLTADAGKGLTDALLAQLLSQFPVGVKPTHFFMSRRSRMQLQKSRTVTLFGQGGMKPAGNQAVIAPVPTEYDGVPIVATDSISNVEALE